MPRPWLGGDGDRLAEAERVELGSERLVLRPVDLVGGDHDTAEPSGAAGRRARRRPVPGRCGRRRRAGSPPRPRSPLAPAPGRRVPARRSRPGRRRRCRSGRSLSPFHSHSSARRSRVTPGSASVTASRPPASRLIRVLFPAFGKPTTATAGRRRNGRASRARPAADLHQPIPLSRASSAIRSTT